MSNGEISPPPNLPHRGEGTRKKTSRPKALPLDGGGLGGGESRRITTPPKHAKQPQTRFDVAIVGGGIAGTTFAAILGDAGLDVALVERQAPSLLTGSAYDGRTTAITYGSRKVLEAAGLWADLAPHACPIDDIRVADGASPLFLHFDSREVGDDPLGSIVENRLIRESLFRRIAGIETVTQIAPATVAGLDTTARWPASASPTGGRSRPTS